MTPMLSVADASGKPLMQGRPYHHRTDPFLDFTAPADGEYVARVHDMTFRGGLPYRLVIANLPHIEQVYPMAIVPGEKAELTLFGRNLPGGRPASWKIHDDALEQLPFTLNPTAYAARAASFTFSRHMPSASVNARGIQVWPIKEALNPITLAFADAPITLDKEPNDTAETAQPITVPTVICGRFDKPGDADWYSFSAKKGDSFAVDLLCERLELPGDPYVLVFDGKGNEIATFDDHGINFNALAQANRDPLGVLQIPADGQYKLFVQERYRNGGARFQYVLKITNVVPDFYPVLVHETPNEPSCPCLRQGGSVFYELCLNRRNYQGPVTVEAEGLPPGMRCDPVHVSPQGQFANIVFTAAPDAPNGPARSNSRPGRLIDGKKIEREVRPVQRRYPVANINTSVMLREICLAVRDRRTYAVQLPSESCRSPPARAWKPRQGPCATGPSSRESAAHWPESAAGFFFATTTIAAEADRDDDQDQRRRQRAAGRIHRGAAWRRPGAVQPRSDGDGPAQCCASPTLRRRCGCRYCRKWTKEGKLASGFVLADSSLQLDNRDIESLSGAVAWSAPDSFFIGCLV